MKPRLAHKAAHVALPRGGDREAFLDAAYEMIGKAWVVLDEKRGRPSAVLTAKGAIKVDLAGAFQAAYAEACLRRAADNERRVLEAAALSCALKLADQVDARRLEPEPRLPPERLDEIARLLAEHEAAPKNAGAIRTPWEDRRK